MAGTILDLGNGFWNIRGVFRLGGFLDIGTQASLVLMSDGSFTLLDSYGFDDATQAALDAITGGRGGVTRVVNTHPFHTVHTSAAHARYPGATHHGTARHVAKFPDLTWSEMRSEDPELAAALAPDLELSRPAGVTFIPENEAIHCASILAFHPASGSIHVDDTFNYRILGLGRRGRLSVHPTLRMALEKRAGAARDFRDWGAAVTRDWAGARQICTAHNGVLGADDLPAGLTVTDAMAEAIARSERTLKAHEKRWG